VRSREGERERERERKIIRDGGILGMLGEGEKE
jgi:hypothetical protein